MRRTGPADVQPLTANQQQIIKRLLDAHGLDIHVRSPTTSLHPRGAMRHTDGLQGYLHESEAG